MITEKDITREKYRQEGVRLFEDSVTTYRMLSPLQRLEALLSMAVYVSPDIDRIGTLMKAQEYYTWLMGVPEDKADEAVHGTYKYLDECRENGNDYLKQIILTSLDCWDDIAKKCREEENSLTLQQQVYAAMQTRLNFTKLQGETLEYMISRLRDQQKIKANLEFLRDSGNSSGDLRDAVKLLLENPRIVADLTA